jgi:hypothetical protein
LNLTTQETASSPEDKADERMPDSLEKDEGSKGEG